ncbi:unnamed protein product [Closterium sp. NIES-64]|nr:unnamed protein product [Closterium sp. NIES-64]
MVLSNDIDLLHPPAELEKRKHKMKRLVPTPNSFFMAIDWAVFYSVLHPLCPPISVPSFSSLPMFAQRRSTFPFPFLPDLASRHLFFSLSCLVLDSVP